jgi:hypothetical protein
MNSCPLFIQWRFVYKVLVSSHIFVPVPVPVPVPDERFVKNAEFEARFGQ